MSTTTYGKNMLINQNLAQDVVVVVVVIVVTRLLPRDGGMAEDHGSPEAGQLPRAWTKDRKQAESRQKASGPKSS